jgi:hypothetical protein
MYTKLELDPVTRMLLNAGAETTKNDIEDPLQKPKLNDDPNLNVTFSDSESEDLSATDTTVLPVPKYLLHLGLETKLGFHDDIPLESAVYDLEDVKISIKEPLILATITDHPDYYFLTQVKKELARFDDEIHSSKYLYPADIVEIHFDLGLLSAKILHYASHYGCSTSPGWTLAKDVPDAMINAMLTTCDGAPLLIHMAQMHILLTRGILMDHKSVSRGKPLQRCMYQEHRTSHGRHARIDITTILHNAPQLHYTRCILHTQYAPNLAEVPGARLLLPKSSRSSPCSKGARFKGLCNKSLLTKIPFQKIPKPSPIGDVRVLFIGTQFSILYTFMYSPA